MNEFMTTHNEKILPAVMALLSIGSSVVYGIKGDMGRAMYWLCAAGLTMSITFLIK